MVLPLPALERYTPAVLAVLIQRLQRENEEMHHRLELVADRADMLSEKVLAQQVGQDALDARVSRLTSSLIAVSVGLIGISLDFLYFLWSKP